MSDSAGPAGQNVTPEKAVVPFWSNAFLSALRETGVVRDACEAAGISRTTAYRVRDADPEFAAAWEDAIQDAADLLELEAVRRARMGVREPVIYKGQLCGMWVDEAGNVVADGAPGARLVPLSVTKYSDPLLMFLLKGIRPEKYRDQPPQPADALAAAAGPAKLVVVKGPAVVPPPAGELDEPDAE